MTAPDHTITPLKNFLPERGHPYMWSRNSSGLSGSRRLCASRPGFAPPGWEFSRFSFLSVERGFDELRDILSGR